MKFFITTLLVCFLSLPSWAKVSKATTPENTESTSDNLISVLYGRWEGKLDYRYYESTELKKTYSNEFRIEVAPTSINFYDKNDKGEWIKASQKFVRSFKFLMEKNTISGYFLDSGTDEDGLWVESQNMYITLQDENTILIYTMRAVNNTGIKDSKPGTKWMQMSVGELKKQ